MITGNVPLIVLEAVIRLYTPLVVIPALKIRPAPPRAHVPVTLIKLNVVVVLSHSILADEPLKVRAPVFRVLFPKLPARILAVVLFATVTAPVVVAEAPVVVGPANVPPALTVTALVNDPVRFSVPALIVVAPV